MRTNIFIQDENISFAEETHDDFLSQTYSIGLIKAASAGDELKENTNLYMKVNNPEFSTFGIREFRMIPISKCNFHANIVPVDFSLKDENGISFSLDFSNITISDFVNEDFTIRITIPAKFNHRNSWTFSRRIKYDDTEEIIQKDFCRQILNSSLNEYFDIFGSPSYAPTSLDFFIKNEHISLYVDALDSLPKSCIVMSPDSRITIPATGIINMDYLAKLIVDADANYGFDYINCPSGEFYPNQIRELDAKRSLAKIYDKHAVLIHMSFTEPRIVETTGDVVKQVINIILPAMTKYKSKLGDFITTFGEDNVSCFDYLNSDIWV